MTTATDTVATDEQLAEWINQAADVLSLVHYNPAHFFNEMGSDFDEPLCSACQVGALRLAVSGVPATASERRAVIEGAEPDDERVLACCAVLHPGANPEDVFSPIYQADTYGGKDDPERAARCVDHMRNVAAELRGDADRRRRWWGRVLGRGEGGS